MFLEYFERGDREGGWQAFSAIANFILLAGSIAIALLMVFARPLAGCGGARVHGPRRSRHAGAADAHHSAGPILPCDRRLAVGGAAGPGPAPPSGDGAARLFRRHHRRAALSERTTRDRSRGLCLGRARGLGARAVRAAALRLPEDADALVSDPVVSQSRSAALSLAVVSDHARIFDRRGGRVDRQKPGLLPRRRRAVVSAIRAHPDESADRRLRHGGRGRGLPHDQPHGRGRPCGRSLWRAVRRGAADAVRDLRGAGVHDARRIRSGLSDLGNVRQPVQRR